MDQSEYGRRPIDEYADDRHLVQFDLGRKLRQALRLGSFGAGRSMSDIAVEARAERKSISESWFANRKAG
ncbi:hypothetical protein [Schlesneria paludicola]|uniref:hypothetical protein n=1 Tax=Schlesneria paludicola TaxID=360056 RepID=UPI00029ADF26|nr:hypothetical protein [Schlesneria paludicola]